MNKSHPALSQYGLDTDFPLELIQAVNQTHFLHLLAIDPSKVLPPGKSLISAVTQEKLGEIEHDHGDEMASSTSPVVQQQVANVMQTAFWDVTAEKLASPEPSEQNIHIKRLFNDLHEAISSLLPPQDKLVHVLSLPPAPSVAPLYSFIIVLKEVLTTLRRRCAPARDGEIDIQLQALDKLPPKPPFTVSVPAYIKHAETTSIDALSISKLVTESLRAIFTIIDHMKSDLQDFLLGTMSEEQLRSLVVREAKRRERDIIIKLWSPDGQQKDQSGQDVIRESWRAWCRQCKGGDTVSGEERWKSALLLALTSSKPISCSPPRTPPTALASRDADSATQNALPPQLFFSSASLFRLQNYMQAVVIAATLRSLVRIPALTSLQPNPSIKPTAHDFMQRVWDLLEAELDMTPDGGHDSDSSLKLINLEDEVVRARKLVAGALGPGEEKKLREAVKRTLQSSDSVFLLLQKRLSEAFFRGIVAGPSRNNVRIPDRLKTGRPHLSDEHGGKRLKLMFDDDPTILHKITSPSIVGLTSPIKGFEDPVLLKAIEEAFEVLAKIIGWTENVWGDLI